jgi:hypothetical protein
MGRLGNALFQLVARTNCLSSQVHFQDKISRFALSSQIIGLAVTLVHHYLVRHCFAESNEVARLYCESFLVLANLEYHKVS